MSKKKTSNYSKKRVVNKKVLDGVDLKVEAVKDFDEAIKNIRKDILEDEIRNGKENKENIKSNDINDKIQSIVSILFTIVIFLLILVLIFVLYNKFLKKEEKIDKEKVCSEYIKKNYHIDNTKILDFIKENRFIIYNIEEFDNSNIDSKAINDFSKFIIWNSDSEYSICSDHEYCLDTKKEMDYDTLKENLKYYFNLESFNLIFDYDFKSDDTTRLFINNDKVILTFKSMQYETFKHDIVDTRIDEDNIYIIFAISRKISDDNYVYTGYKNLELKYTKDKFIIKNIKTTITQ